MSLVTTAQVAAILGRDLTAAETATAQILLDSVESYLSRRTGIGFGELQATQVALSADGHGRIELPLRPVREVTAVTWIDGTATDWTFDGQNTVEGLWPGQVMRVSWTYGFDTLPADLTGVVLGAVSRQMLNPSGVRQKTVGSESITYAAGAGSVALSAMESEIVDSYTTTAASWRLVLDTVDPTRRLPTL